MKAAESSYPAYQDLRRLQDWPIHDLSEIRPLLDHARSLWAYPDYWRQSGRVVRVATGGWSGNEDVIAALRANRMFWALCWWQSTRGGKHVFKIPKG